MDYYGVVFAHLATGRGINAKDPSGLDSDRWIPHSVDSRATSQRDSPIWIQPLGVFRYRSGHEIAAKGIHVCLKNEN